MKQERLLKIIVAPHMSEKAAIAAEKRGEYVFEVASSATKPDVKEAVEQLFKTKVDSVRIVNVKTKPKRFGSIQGHSKAWKKAYVTLEAGQQIDFSGGQA
jgi:large subunit ribosomal protein L23